MLQESQYTPEDCRDKAQLYFAQAADITCIEIERAINTALDWQDNEKRLVDQLNLEDVEQIIDSGKGTSTYVGAFIGKLAQEREDEYKKDPSKGGALTDAEELRRILNDRSKWPGFVRRVGKEKIAWSGEIDYDLLADQSRFEGWEWLKLASSLVSELNSGSIEGEI